MRASSEFKDLPKNFWANVRSLSQTLGYTVRGQDRFLVPTLNDILYAYETLSLNTDAVVHADGSPKELAQKLLSYFSYRADVLENFVQPRLMTAEQAEHLYNELRERLNVSAPSVMNKQKGEKAKPAYLTEITNMLIAEAVGDLPFERDPRQLTSFTTNQTLLRTLARRVDGAFPSIINPSVIWEIKEYYYTTTFGSRVADGVYETLLDGMELAELRQSEGIKVEHLLIIDAHFTWWVKGKSYLCRLIDMLNMGYVSEIIFGREVVEQLPALAKAWCSLERKENRKF